MAQSMTAFSSLKTRLETVRLTWELRSVNHRYLEATFHLPESFCMMEGALRKTLQAQVSRGKLTCHLKVTHSQPPCFKINTPQVQALSEAGDTLALTHNLANDLTVSRILAWPGVIMQDDTLDNAGLEKAVESSFETLVNQLVIARKQEGKALKEAIFSRLKALDETIEHARDVSAASVSSRREKWQRHFQMLSVEMDESRIEQALVLMANRFDVSEELDRLKTHVQAVQQVLDSDGVMGRRLDFLMQELNREANTLSAKSDSAALTQHAVDMKVLIEQMREQIQNIE